MPKISHEEFVRNVRRGLAIERSKLFIYLADSPDVPLSEIFKTLKDGANYSKYCFKPQEIAEALDTLLKEGSIRATRIEWLNGAIEVFFSRTSKIGDVSIERQA